MRIQDGWTTAGRGPGWIGLVVALVLAAAPAMAWQGRVRSVPDGDSLTVERAGRTVKRRADHPAQGLLRQRLVMHLVDRGPFLRHANLTLGRPEIPLPAVRRKVSSDGAAKSPAFGKLPGNCRHELTCREKSRASAAKRNGGKWGLLLPGTPGPRPGI